MRRELFVHLSFWFSFFVFVALFKHFLNLGSWPFWVGGILGVFLPDIDHLVYVLFMNPQDLTSQRVNFLYGRREIIRMIQLLYETRSERKGLIFHTIFFQVIFLILSFWVITSSMSLFARGLVLSFSLHLFVDQFVDLVEIGNLDNWQGYIPITLNPSQSRIYITIVLLLVGILGFMM
jgi:hypothetical protein